MFLIGKKKQKTTEKKSYDSLDNLHNALTV